MWDNEMVKDIIKNNNQQWRLKMQKLLDLLQINTKSKFLEKHKYLFEHHVSNDKGFLWCIS
jgi:hypothetical protein